MAGELFLLVDWMSTYHIIVFDMLRVNFQWTFMMIPQLVQGMCVHILFKTGRSRSQMARHQLRSPSSVSKTSCSTYVCFRSRTSQPNLTSPYTDRAYRRVYLYQVRARNCGATVCSRSRRISECYWHSPCIVHLGKRLFQARSHPGRHPKANVHASRRRGAILQAGQDQLDRRAHRFWKDVAPHGIAW